MTQVQASKTREHIVTVLIDRKAVDSPRKTTVASLLSVAHIDPAKRELVRVKHKHQQKLTDLSAELELHDGEVFVTISTGPTPVS